ncbi:MAG: hypothetical protein PVI23_11355 [Maricaulaceae bacterium]
MSPEVTVLARFDQNEAVARHVDVKEAFFDDRRLSARAAMQAVKFALEDLLTELRITAGIYAISQGRRARFATSASYRMRIEYGHRAPSPRSLIELNLRLHFTARIYSREETFS